MRVSANRPGRNDPPDKNQELHSGQPQRPPVPPLPRQRKVSPWMRWWRVIFYLLMFITAAAAVVIAMHFNDGTENRERQQLDTAAD